MGNAPFIEAQPLADTAAQSFGQRAPAPLTGESLSNYRVRLLSPYQPHSDTWKGSNLNKVAMEPHALAAAESQIYRDAQKVATRNDPGTPLRAVTSRDEAGRMVTRFFGDPAEAWRPFMGAGVRYLIGVNKRAGRE
jgi:hypothetical protein